MRRLFQFRLRTLFVLVTLAAIAALWCSHRMYCLDRAAFHRNEIVRCQEQQVRDTDEFVAAFAKQRNPKQRPLSPVLEKAVRLKKQADFLKKAAKSGVEVQTETIEERIRAELFASLRPNASSGPQRWEDQTVYDSMAQGFLVVPSKVEVAKQESEEPDLVANYESKVSALNLEVTIHIELADQYHASCLSAMDESR